MSGMGSLQISGVVCSGLGKGAYFVQLEWVRSRLRELMGAPPFPGTLNLRVAGEQRERLFAERKRFSPILAPGEEFCPGYLAVVLLTGPEQPSLRAWVVLPEASEHPDMIEIVSPHFLRELLLLKDGDRLELGIEVL